MSAGIAALIAHVAFWLLLVYGWFWDELGPWMVAMFVISWVGGLLALQLFAQGPALFPSYVAILDIVLVFIIFKGDVRLM